MGLRSAVAFVVAGTFVLGWAIGHQTDGLAVPRQINAEVNASHPIYAPLDPGPGDGVFDCEDFAFAKLRALIKAGFPDYAIRLQGFTPSAESRRNGSLTECHMVTLVQDHRGIWWIMDILTPRLVPETERLQEGWTPVTDPSQLDAC